MADAMKVDQRLAIAVYGTTNLTEVDRDNPDGDEIEEHPVAKCLEKARFHKAMEQSPSGAAGSVWDKVIGAVEEKNEERPAGTLAKKLGVTRYEVIDVGGERWSHGYNDRGELVAARLLTP